MLLYLYNNIRLQSFFLNNFISKALYDAVVAIVPSDSPSATETYGNWTMKSGYVFTMDSQSNALASISVYENDFTNGQNAYTMLLELMYSTLLDSEGNDTSSYLSYPPNVY